VKRILLILFFYVSANGAQGYFENYILRPSFCEDRIRVIRFEQSSGGLFYDYLSLDQALFIGIVQDGDAMIREAVDKMRKIKDQFSSEYLLRKIKDIVDAQRPSKLLATFLTLLGCAGTVASISFVKKEPTGTFVFGVMSMAAYLGAYSHLYNVAYKKFATKLFTKIIGLDRSLFVIADMKQTKRVWDEIKPAIDDVVLVQKVEEFFGIV